MEKEKLDQFKKRLLQERKELIDTEASFEKWGKREIMDIAATELSAYDQHPADYGSQMFDREHDIGLLENTENQLAQVDHALERIDAGTYGKCEICGKQIGEERLSALPYLTVCIDCKREDEAKESPDVSARPVEEDVLGPPFARSFKDDDDYAGFDGEDAWQEVAKFGTSNSPQDVPDAISYDETYVDADEDEGIVAEVEGIQDVRNNQASDFEEIYPEPQDNPKRRRYRVPKPKPPEI